MFKRKNLLLALALLVPTAFPAQAQPTSTVGKIGAGLLQIAHRHSYLLTMPVGPLSYAALKEQDLRHCNSDTKPSFIASIILWLCAGSLLKTTSKVIMDACDIRPVQV